MVAMNLRQSVLVTSFCGTLFMNFASIYWNMWSVASISLFVLMITDFMFFEVTPDYAPLLPLCLSHIRRLRAALSMAVLAAAFRCSSPRPVLTPCVLTSSYLLCRTTSSGHEHGLIRWLQGAQQHHFLWALALRVSCERPSTTYASAQCRRPADLDAA